MYLLSALLLGPCVVLGYVTVVDYERFLFLAPITGYAWSAWLLIYGRLLGGVAWIISGERELAKRDIRRLRNRNGYRPLDLRRCLWHCPFPSLVVPLPGPNISCGQVGMRSS
jgi:hypothetical protein